MTVDEKLSIARGIVTPLLRKIRAGKCHYQSREYLIFDCQIFNAIWPVFLRMMNMWINSIPGKCRSSLDCWERRRWREVRFKKWVSLACLRYLNQNDSDPIRYYSFDTAFSFSAVLFADTHTHTLSLLLFLSGCASPPVLIDRHEFVSVLSPLRDRNRGFS